MSTMIALFLVLSTLAGCASETLANVKNAAPLPTPPPVDVFQVELEQIEETYYDDDGAELAVCAYEVPLLKTDSGEEAALALVDAFNEPFASWKTNGEALAQTAQENRELMGSSVAYTDELHCSIYRTDRLISVSGVHYTYTGGAHPNTILLSWNFDLESGAFFTPAILDTETGLHDTVLAALQSQARQRAREAGQKPEEFFWEDYQETLANWSNYPVSFDEEGMTVGFSPYELACYAAGSQVFQIPYEDLRDCLSEQGLALLGLEPLP